MAWHISNLSENVLTIVNEDTLSPLNYTIHYLTDAEIFDEFSTYPTLPSTVLAAGASVDVDLEDDGVYKVIIDGSPDTESYILMDYNIKLCEREMIQDLLCKKCDPCKSVEFMKDIRNKLVFNVIKNNLYFIWNKWVQTQSITDIITPPNDEILYLADLKTQLSKLCAACNDTCDNCGKVTSISSDCGCS